MEDGPDNFVTRRARISLLKFGDPSAVGDLRDGMTDDFVREDRRKLIATPSVGPDEWIESIRAFSELGAGIPTFTMPRVIAVRGETLALFEVHVEFPDGSEMGWLVLAVFDSGRPPLSRLSIMYDLDDVDGALEELNRLSDAADPANA